MNSPDLPQISMVQTAWQWWKYAAGCEGELRATRRLFGVLWEFARDSTPDRLRARFGDADYDWDFRVNTTSGAVGWRDRLIGAFHSDYQPTEPAAFREMLEVAEAKSGIDFAGATFVDLGSGKGRTLLMASDFPFRRILGVELLPSLHRIAVENIRQYKSESQKCFAIESVCADATAFPLPEGPLLVYLFNPFPESGMRRVVANLDGSVREHPRRVCAVYHNPLLEHTVAESTVLERIVRTEQYAVYATRDESAGPGS